MDHNGVVLAIMEKSIFPDVAILMAFPSVGRLSFIVRIVSYLYLHVYSEIQVSFPLQIDM